MPWVTNSEPNAATGEAFVELKAANGALSAGANNVAVDEYILYALTSLNTIQSRPKSLSVLSRSCARVGFEWVWAEKDEEMVKALDDDVTDELVD